MIKNIAFFSLLSSRKATDHLRNTGLDSRIIFEFHTGAILYEGVNLDQLAQIRDQGRTVVKHK